MQLAKDIRDFYFDHLDQLERDKQFHFCTRIAAWENDLRAITKLQELRPYYLPNNREKVQSDLQALISHPPAARINADTLRQVYFQKYPSLRGLDFALFRVRHIDAIYGTDVRQSLLSVVSLEQLRELKTQLLQDPDALRILSTYAINYLYLLERVIARNDEGTAIPLAALFDLGKAYDTASPEQLQLFIYLYTHCIIGESNFYARQIPEQLLPVYRAMLTRLESLITEYYDRINLDNKLEFLVCCHICQVDSPLFERIHAECQDSISPDGTFLVDRHNQHAQNHRTSLEASEHRNVLFILSTSAYEPRYSARRNVSE